MLRDDFVGVQHRIDGPLSLSLFRGFRPPRCQSRRQLLDYLILFGDDRIRQLDRAFDRGPLLLGAWIFAVAIPFEAG